MPQEAQPALLKSYVRVDIEAGELKDVCEIPRVALRENDRVWVRDGEGLLQILDVDVLWRELEGRVDVVSPLADWDHGMREFQIRDCNGYVLRFGQPIEHPAS